MVENATRLHDGHPPCMDTALRVPPGRSAGGSRDLVALLCPARWRGFFLLGSRHHGTRTALET